MIFRGLKRRKFVEFSQGDRRGVSKGVRQALERLQMLYWLKRGIAKNRKELAQLLQPHEATISRWLLKYRCGGLAKLLEVKRAPGNPVKIQPTAVAQLQQRLSQPEGFHSYGEAQECFQLFINQVSQRFAESVVILQMDRAKSDRIFPQPSLVCRECRDSSDGSRQVSPHSSTGLARKSDSHLPASSLSRTQSD